MRGVKERPMAIAMQRCKDLRREYQRIWEEVYRQEHDAGDAYSAAGVLNPQIYTAYEALGELTPKDSDLLKGDATELEKAFEFLETDILAFRCGYWKSQICNLLKKVPLEPPHVQRVKKLALTYVLWPGFRAEFRELSRLTIIHADEDLIRDLEKVCDEAEDEAVLKKARSLLYRILNSRVDLREVAPLEKYKPQPGQLP